MEVWFEAYCFGWFHFFVCLRLVTVCDVGQRRQGREPPHLADGVGREWGLVALGAAPVEDSAEEHVKRHERVEVRGVGVAWSSHQSMHSHVLAPPRQPTGSTVTPVIAEPHAMRATTAPPSSSRGDVAARFAVRSSGACSGGIRVLGLKDARLIAFPNVAF